MLTIAALVAGLLGVVPQSGSADLAVDLNAQNTILLAGARYDVTITNNGPDRLESATVVVQLDNAPLPSGAQNTCTVDRDARTLTCDFGALAVGASATRSATVYYSLGGRPRLIYATATRTASTPADPNQANDSDTKTCFYNGAQGIPIPPTPSLTC